MFKFEIKNQVSQREKELAKLVNSCYLTILIWKPRSPAEEFWKNDWLEKAGKLVPRKNEMWY